MCPNPRPGPALGPAGALLSAVHISVRVSALGSGFSELLLDAVRPPQRRRSRNSSRSGYFGGAGCARIWVCTLSPTPPGPRPPDPRSTHVIGLAVPGSLKALCWLPPLTSETWPARRRWAPAAERRPCHRISKTLLWGARRCQKIEMLPLLWARECVKWTLWRASCDVWFACVKETVQPPLSNLHQKKKKSLEKHFKAKEMETALLFTSMRW